jgi:hypothetical protein
MGGIHIVICTLRRYKVFYDKLIKSIPNIYKIITVYQEEETDCYEKLPDENYEVRLKRNIYEYGAWTGLQMLIDAGEVSRDDWYLMIHDTCLFTRETPEKLHNVCTVLYTTNVDVYYLVLGRFHNICLVRRQGIEKIAKIFEDIHTMTKKEALDLECSLLPDGVSVAEFPSGTEHMEPHLGRTTAFLPSINIYKFFTSS